MRDIPNEDMSNYGFLAASYKPLPQSAMGTGGLYGGRYWP